MNQQDLADFIWNVADALRGNFKPSLFGRIILPFTVLRRMECVLEPTRTQVQEHFSTLAGTGVELDLVLPNVAGASFYNTSKFTLATVGSTSTRSNLEEYVSKFSSNARQIFEHFGFDQWLLKLETANLLYLVTQKFAGIDALTGEGVVRTVYDCAAGTGGLFVVGHRAGGRVEPPRAHRALRAGTEPRDLCHQRGRQADPGL